jgi:hypothetical protein
MCCPKKHPKISVKKNKKNFDSADYFMELAKENGSSHPITS